ncbi:MAG: hypothetical protein K2M47_02580 [Clostridiales bacterium]|nr:hypothetical protein [Clostridiales bacterium]
MNNIKRKAFANIVLSFLFLGTVIVRYIGCWDKCVEMTFMSNAATGVVLLIGGVYALIFKRDIPHFLYLDCAVLMSSVVIACSIFEPTFLVVGFAIIPHLVNPIVIFVYYLKFCNGRNCKVPHVLTALVFPTAYYVFMVLFGVLGSHAVYPQFDPNIISVLNLSLVGASALVGLFVVGVVLLIGNKALHGGLKRFGKKDENGETAIIE